MNSLLETSSARGFVILAPSRDSVPDSFQNLETASSSHSEWLQRAQKLRGQAYLEDGAVAEGDLDSEGRLVSPFDERSWHVIQRDSCGEIAACCRVTTHASSEPPERLALADSSLFLTPGVAERARAAIVDFQASARRAGAGFCEVGGLAVAKHCRGSRKSSLEVLAVWALCKVLGLARGIATVTTRHDSCEILRRMGMSPLSDTSGPLPPYFDDHYGCFIHLMSWFLDDLSSRFADAAKILTAALREAQAFQPAWELSTLPRRIAA